MPGAVEETPATPQAQPAPDSTILPTLFGEGYGLYRTKPATFLFSFVVHTLVLLGLGLAGSYLAGHRKEIQRQVVAVVTDISPYVLPPSNTKAGGGGGGGE